MAFLKSWISLFFLWVLFFCLDRSFQFVYFIEKIPQAAGYDLLLLLGHALRLDVSMTAYVMAFPLLLAWAHARSWFWQTWRIYQSLMGLVFGLLAYANINLFREWGSKISAKAIKTAWDFPYEVGISSLSMENAWTGLFYLPLIALWLYVSHRILIRRPQQFQVRQTSMLGKWKFAMLWVLGLGLNFLGIRGGWQLSPINIGMAQYQTDPVSNQLVVNTHWLCMQQVFQSLGPQGNPYAYFNDQQVKQLLKLEELPSNSLPILAKKGKPNVVIIILESHTADVIESLGGIPGVNPEMEQLIKEGVLFTGVHASAERTDKGLIAILSGFPSQATRSIINEPLKQERLPSLSKALKTQGYHTSFYYGGESEFFGLKSYLISHRYDRLVDQQQFDSKDFNSKWGAYDHIVLKKQAQDLSKEPQPFFSVLLTLSNHEPFEVPGKAAYPGADLPSKFKSTAHYTDASLGAYFREVKTMPWYTNTLFVLVADHGHRLPKRRYEIWEQGRYRIPLLILGPALHPDLKGKKIPTLGSQTDLYHTLLNAMGVPHLPWYWSQDLMDVSNPQQRAFFTWDNGFAWHDRQGTWTYDAGGNRWIEKGNSLDSLKMNRTKAYMQAIYQTYLDF